VLVVRATCTCSTPTDSTRYGCEHRPGRSTRGTLCEQVVAEVADAQTNALGLY
jgi:hypothetical protein